MAKPEPDRESTPEQIDGRDYIEALYFTPISIGVSGLRRETEPDRWPEVRARIERVIVEVEEAVEFGSVPDYEKI